MHSARRIGASTMDGVCLACIHGWECGDKFGELGGISLFLTLECKLYKLQCSNCQGDFTDGFGTSNRC